MSKLLATVLAAVFAVVTITPVAYAMKHEGEKKEMKAEKKKGEPKKKGEGKKKAEPKKKGEGKKKAEEKK
jgi:hypothetical protein